MNYIDKQQIKVITEKILVEANIDKPAVMADRVAEFNCDLEFEWVNLDKYCDDSEILAAISIRDKKIYMNNSHEQELRNNLGRMNFTIAHELGHWILHKDSAQEKLPGFTDEFLICRGINNSINDRERQADTFAAHLLMPEKFVKAQLNNFKTYLNEYDLKQIANVFRVSKQAMQIRLVKELRLLYPAKGLYYKSELEAMEACGQLTLF